MGAFAMPAANLKPEPIEGNSMTQYLRSLNNYAGSAAPGLMQAGYGTLGQGTNMMGQGAEDVAGAQGALQPVMRLWNSILSGNRGAAMQMMGPQFSDIANRYATTRQAMGEMAPRSGASTTVNASLPYQAIRDQNTLMSQLLPTAAQGAQSAAGMMGQLGGTRANIGQGMGQLGLAQSGQGQNMLQMALQSLLGMRGQDVNEHGQAMGLAGGLGGGLLNKLSFGPISLGGGAKAGG